jgi:CRISPR system Cascade subunit CasE
VSAHLSLLRLDPDDKQVSVDMRDVSDLHRTIMSAFADLGGAGRARADLGILYRLTVEGNQLTLLVQSQVRPRWDNLPRGYLCEAPAVRPLEPLLDRIVQNSLWQFRLVANATVARDGRRHGLTRESDLVDWLIRRDEQLGARVDAHGAGTFTARDLGDIRGRRRTDRITVRQASFEGILQTIDAAALKRAVLAGVGHARAYGCGLLSLAPVE